METSCNFEVISDAFKFTEEVFNKNTRKWLYILYRNLGLSEWVTPRLPLLPNLSVFCKVWLRMKKDLSIEHIIQYITNRCQYCDRYDKLSVLALRIKKTLLCVSEWEKHRLSWLPVMSNSLCHVERRFHVTFWGWINIWASIIQYGKSPFIVHYNAPMTDAIVMLKKKLTPSPSTIYWVNVQIILLRTRAIFKCLGISVHIITTSVNPL